MNRLSVFLWTVKVVSSCETIHQLVNCNKLITRNLELYHDIGIYTFLCDLQNNMLDELKNELEQACLETNEYLEQ